MSRRKPTLQLGSKTARNNGQPGIAYVQRSKAGAGLGLLGTYADDSEDEVDEPEENDDEQKLPMSTLDSKVADFLKEINDLETQNEPSVKSSKSKSTSVEKVNESNEDSNAFEISWGPWKQCIDENTNHPYYWNTETNEVSWTLPEEVMMQYEHQTKPDQEAPLEQKVVEQESSKSSKMETKADKQQSQAETLLISRTSLKSAIQEKRKELEKRKKETQLTPAKQSETKAASSPKNDYECDIDIDAELESALYSPEVERRKRSSNEKVASAKRPKTASDSSDNLNTNQENTDTVTEEILYIHQDSGNDDNNTGQSESRFKSSHNDSDNSSEDMDFSDDLSKYDMTTLLEDDTRASGQRERSSSPACDSNVAPAVATAPIVEKSDKSVQTIEIKADAKKETASSDDKAKGEIKSICAILLDKLAFLEISRNSLTGFHKLLMEIEVRSSDFEAGALSGEYFKARLDDANKQLEKYEKHAVPAGWSCRWESEYKRYYYVNTATGQTQWAFPHDTESSKQSESQDVEGDLVKTGDKPEAATEKKTNTSDQVARDDGSTADCAKSENPEEDVQKEVVSGKEADGSSVTPCTGEAGTTNMLDYSAYNMHNYQYWGMSGQYGMPYAYRHPMAAYDDSFRHSPANDAPPPPPPGEEVAPPPPDPADKPPLPPPPPGDDEPSPHPPPLPVEADANDPAVLDDGTEMDISDVEDTGTIKEHQGVAELKRGPVEYSAAPSVPVIHSDPVPLSSSAQMMRSADVELPHGAAMKSSFIADKNKKVKKIKKDKGAVKKPPREMFGMVAKWQRAKQEIEDEEKRLINESERELDEQLDSNLRIQKWKQEQLQTGRAALNANFEPISDDWRKRIKQRKNRVT